jgi:hypothetical protein
MTSKSKFGEGLDPSRVLGRFGLLSRPILMFLLVLAISLDYRFMQNIKGSPSFTALEGLTYFAFLIFLADGIIYKNSVRDVFSGIWEADKYVLVYALWIGTLCFANFVRGYGFSTLSNFKDLLPSIMLLIVMYAYGRSQEGVNNILKIYLVGLGINVCLGVMQGTIGMPRPVPMSMGAAAKMDLNGHIMSKNLATGLFTHPNGFALYLIPCLILLVMVAFKRIDLGKWWRTYAIGALPLLLFAYYRSQGKGAIAWALLGCILALMPIKSRRTSLYLMLAAMVGGVVFLSVGSLYVADHFHIKSLTTMLTRVQLWQAGVHAVMTDSGFFLFGVASNNVLYASYRYTGGTFPYPNAHNGIINQAVYFGVPCMIIYLMMIYKAVSSLTKGSDSQLMASPQVVRFAMASVIALVGDYFFEPASEGVLLQGQFFFLLALCLILTAKPVKYFSSTSLQQRHANILGAIK